MKSLAYLYLILAYKTSTSSEAKITIQQIEERRGQAETKKVSSNLSSVFGIHLLQKFFPNLILNFMLKIPPIVLTLVFLLSSPVFALNFRGNSGKDIVDLQNNLKLLGYFPKNSRSTGYFNKVTETSVRNFQKANRLVVDGKVDSDTKKSLDKAMHEYRVKQKIGKAYRSPILVVGSKGAVVAQLKEHLNGLGYSAGSGELFDKQTEEAVKLFQEKNGLKIDGIVGTQTDLALRSLGRDHSNPESPISYYYQGQDYQDLDNKKEALENYYKYLNLANDLTEVTKLRLWLEKKGDANKANISCSAYNQEVTKDYINSFKAPISTEQYTKRGKLLFWLGSIKYARDDFEQAIKKFESKINETAKKMKEKPKYPKEYTDNQGNLKLFLKNDNPAKDDFGKVIKELEKVTKNNKDEGYQIKELASAYYYLAQSFVYDKDGSKQDYFRVINYFDKAVQLYTYANYKLSNSPKTLEAIQIKKELSETSFTKNIYVISTSASEYHYDKYDYITRKDYVNSDERRQKYINSSKKFEEIKDIANNLIQADNKKEINLNSEQLAQAYYLRAYTKFITFGEENPPNTNIKSNFDFQPMEDITQAFRINPYFYLNHSSDFHEGYPCPEVKDDQQVLNDLSKEINQNSQSVDAYFNRGIFYLKLRNEEAAIKDFNKVIDDLKVRDVAAYSNRGFAYYRQKKYDKAIADFNTALSQRESADLYIIRALAFFDSGKYEKAYKDCEKAIQLTSPKNSKNDLDTLNNNTNTSKFFFIRGRVRYAMQEIQKAQKDFSIVSPAPGNENSMWPLWAPGQGGGAKSTETAQQNEVMKEKIRGAQKPKRSTQCQPSR